MVDAICCALMHKQVVYIKAGGFMVKRAHSLLFVCLVVGSVEPFPVDYAASYEITGHAKGNHATVAFLKNQRSEEYVIKQIKKSEPLEQFQLVVDMLCCHMAQFCSVPINEIICIPPGVAFVGKDHIQLPATLHTRMPGICLNRLDQTTLQRFKQMDYQVHLVPDAVCMRYSVIRSIAQQRDLPKIAALDTFVGNTDRTPGNLIYDELTDHFYGIDLANAYRGSTMVSDACKQLKVMIKKPVTVRFAERMAMQEYVATLRSLLYIFPPEKQIALLVQFAQEAGFKDGSPLLDKKTKLRLYFHIKNIKKNYKDCEKLVELFDEFLNKS